MNHVHKLKKHKYRTGSVIYFCILDNCHYKLDAALIEGKQSLCHQCGEPFIMTGAALKLSRPHCNDCGKVLVKGPDGKRTYVWKRTSGIMASVAEESANDLRSRLQNVTSIAGDEDI